MKPTTTPRKLKRPRPPKPQPAIHTTASPTISTPAACAMPPWKSASPPSATSAKPTKTRKPPTTRPRSAAETASAPASARSSASAQAPTASMSHPVLLKAQDPVQARAVPQPRPSRHKLLRRHRLKQGRRRSSNTPDLAVLLFTDLIYEYMILLSIYCPMGWVHDTTYAIGTAFGKDEKSFSLIYSYGPGFRHRRLRLEGKARKCSVNIPHLFCIYIMYSEEGSISKFDRTYVYIHGEVSGSVELWVDQL